MSLLIMNMIVGGDEVYDDGIELLILLKEERLIQE